ncbi:Uncharacterised protein [Serratia fonticola]|uniref:Uncharacterized protein n=1 Tax=Serratia fonticola TaxID=47917 RepID=A0A4U9TZ40_SERFO|nr:Uncharacterised protein [Serratia fonticola]
MAQALLKLAPTDYPGQQPIPLRKVLAVKGWVRLINLSNASSTTSILICTPGSLWR